MELARTLRPNSKACVVLRLAALLCALFVLQGLALGVAQVVRPAHYHVAAGAHAHAHSRGLPHSHDELPAPHVRNRFAGFAGHAHHEVEHHRHDADDDSVVYVADDDASGSGLALLKRFVQGADLLETERPAVALLRLDDAAPSRHAACTRRSRTIEPAVPPPR